MVKSSSRLVSFCTKALATACVGLALCAPALAEAPQATQTDPVDLEGHTLMVYCGAGMTDPFTQIAEAFQEATGCEMAVTFGNAAQIQTQITTTEEGDFFIAGSAEELQPVEDYVESSTELVKHIPVLVVQPGNPLEIKGMKDLASCQMILVGDPEATPIGKIAKNILTNVELWDQLMADGKLTTTTTAPQIAAALEAGEGDAGIVWKENVTGDVEIVECEPMVKAIKVIPAAQLTCCQDPEAAEAFLAFLGTTEAQDIWTSFGYELVPAADEAAEADADAADADAEAPAADAELTPAA